MKRFAVIIIFLLIPVWVSATTYISDHFDAQDDWVGKVGATCYDPPSPWDGYGYYCREGFYINATGAHGGSGKGVTINWTQSMTETALTTPTSVPTGKSELWIGFWYKHSSGWNWGSDTTHKWYYGPETNASDRMMINYDQYHRAFWAGNTQFQSNIPFNVNDDEWHSVIIYLKHSTGTGNNDGAIRMWWDGTEATWTGLDAHVGRTNLQCDFGSGATWTSYSCIGFQSRPNWGSGNISYYDDIIFASTEAEVTEFLGLDEDPAPAPPTLKFYLTNPSSSGAGQGNPNNSLGGYRSTTQVSASAMKNLFDDVTVVESVLGDTEYRFLDVYNSGDSSASKVQVYVKSDSSSSGTEITLGYNATNQPHEDSWDGEDVANEDTAPASPAMTFGTYTKESPLHLGTIPAGRSVRICVKRTVTAGVPWTARDVGTIAVRYLGD